LSFAQLALKRQLSYAGTAAAKRKTTDIAKLSHTIWLQNSIGLRPEINRGTTGFWFVALEKVEDGSLSLDCFHKHPNARP
jgi:hypothetical protein